MQTDAQKRAKTKWRRENSYTTTITFYKNNFPKEKFEKAKEEIKKMGLSQNEFFIKKLRELIGDE